MGVPDVRALDAAATESDLIVFISFFLSFEIGFGVYAFLGDRVRAV